LDSLLAKPHFPLRLPGRRNKHLLDFGKFKISEAVFTSKKLSDINLGFGENVPHRCPIGEAS
jgi:hypothetical protein